MRRPSNIASGISRTRAMLRPSPKLSAQFRLVFALTPSRRGTPFYNGTILTSKRLE
jgi:hypothetical protein